MRVLRAHDANMIDSYSRLKRVDETALFYALAEFSNEVSPDHLREITTDLANGELTEGVVLKGSFGAGPPLTATVGEDLKLPQGVTVRQPEGPTDVTGARKRRARQAEPDRRSDLGAPYYQRRRGGSAWTLKPAEVFMAVPFSEIYAPFYRDYIAAAVRDAGLEPIRVDELPVDAEWRQTIDRIEEGIARARFVLADVSGWNLNVIYEVGLAVGISKPLLVLCDAEHLEKREIPFDIAPYPLVKYSLWESGNFRADLSAKIRQMSKATEPPGTAA
jgi:hypothetical protein